MDKYRKILVIGGTGFTGRQVLRQLEKKENVEVTCLIRSLHKTPSWTGKGRFETIVGDLNSPESLDKAFKDKDALIFVASMGFGHMPNVINAAQDNHVKRAVFTSSTAIFTRLPAQSRDGREAGEKHVTTSTLDWTLLRPTMIFGRKGDRNIERLIRNLRRFPVFFIPGPGDALQQPVFVDDVAKAALQALWSENTIRKSYNISGRKPLSFKALVRASAEGLNRNVKILSLPLFPIRVIARLYASISSNPKITEEQILRLNEDKAFDFEDAARDFNFNPVSFSEGLAHLVKETA